MNACRSCVFNKKVNSKWFSRYPSMIAKLASSYWFSQTAVPTLSPEHPTGSDHADPVWWYYGYISRAGVDDRLYHHPRAGNEYGPGDDRPRS